ncbi:serine hydrolase [Spongiivirga sp. MCCC 1A20706]|uniref:serine hydrolase n=1 Tax=Spongiivirga sp. MCCC 1A20706 TaxID=3160963 RepID=UPI0039777ACB
MVQKFFAIALLFLTCKYSFSQNLNTDILDRYFESLERRNEAMGSITISKDGLILYSKAIGFRNKKSEVKINADTATNYRIWSITKLYTATMIMQLVEEEKLTLDTKLIHFFPEIPNAGSITIKNMLNHKSGIHDFTQNDSTEDWDTHINEAPTRKFMVKNIAQYPPDFQPNQDFRYSNSNYLLLGYIIEQLDGHLYETSLANRISSKLGLKSTYFGVGALDSVENKAFSYKFDKQWTTVDEGEFSGLIPAGAGGIVSTTNDMVLFIEGLFSGKLVTKESLNSIIPKNEFYGLGMMKTSFQGTSKGYGHTGGYIASESSLFYYPEDNVSIAYATNGIVIRKEEILENVLKIYNDHPFNISMNRNIQALLIVGLGLIFFLLLKLKFRHYVATKNLLYLGYIIVLLYWIGVFISGYLNGNHNFIKDGITSLDAFYSSSGTFMAGIQTAIAFILLPFIYSIYQSCVQLKVNILPLIPLCFIPISLLGSSLFPFPNQFYQIFTNAILLITLGPLLAILIWRKSELSKLRRHSFVCFAIMLLSILLVIIRPSIPEFVHNYWGLVQGALYVGWTLWLYFLSTYFLKSARMI